MSIEYRVYANDGAGGAVDYGTIVATTSSLTWTSGALTAPGDYTFVVKTHDTATGLEDQHSDCRVRVTLDGTGADTRGLPLAPSGLSAIAGAGGAATVRWQYPAGPAVTGFRVYMGTPTVSYASPAATVAVSAWGPGARYSATLLGLSDGVTYQVAVRSYNAVGEESNTATVSVVGKVSGPSPVVSLAAAAVP